MVHYIDKSSYPYNKKGSKKSKSKEQPKKGYLGRKFAEFCKRTDLHGYKYIVMEDLNAFERSCWAVAVLVSTACAVYFVVTAYKWYARNPIVTVIESTQGAIWDIPFPAVTICNLNMISRSAARMFADSVTLPANVTADLVFEAVRYAPMLHTAFEVHPSNRDLLHMLQTVLDLNGVSVETFFLTMSPAASCSDLVKRCMWKNTMYRCDDLFQQVLTYFAVCCSFNYFAIEDKTQKEQSITPRRVASCGYQTALTVLVDTQPHDYYSTPVASQGAMVFIDNAHNIADLDSPVRVVNPATEVLISLSPESTYTTPGIRTFNPQERQCYYNDEVKIGSFRHYSFHNCMSYQRVEHTKTVCDCIPYYFPIKDYHRVCNFKDLDCLTTYLVEVDNKTTTTEFLTSSCLPECEHYDYPLEVALGKLAENVRLDGLPFFNDVSLDNRSLVNVFFNDLVSTRYRRDVYLNWQNLLASFGGLLSLMLGFTLISGFDLILFFTFGLAYSSLSDARTHNTKVADCNNSKPPPSKSNKIYVQERYKAKEHNKNKSDLSKRPIMDTKYKWQNDLQFKANRY